MNERRLAILGRFAELSLSLAEDLHQAALVAETMAEKARAAEAMNRLSRSARQSLLLHARLVPQARRAKREDADHARAARERAVKARKAQAGAERLIYEAREEEDFELVEELDRVLEDEAFADDFTEAPVAVIITRLCRALGLPEPQTEPALEPPRECLRPAPPREAGPPLQSSA